MIVNIERGEHGKLTVTLAGIGARPATASSPAVVCDATLTLNINEIALSLAHKAVTAKSKRSRVMHGDVTLEVTDIRGAR